MKYVIVGNGFLTLGLHRALSKRDDDDIIIMDANGVEFPLRDLEKIEENERRFKLDYVDSLNLLPPDKYRKPKHHNKSYKRNRNRNKMQKQSRKINRKK